MREDERGGRGGVGQGEARGSARWSLTRDRRKKLRWTRRCLRRKDAGGREVERYLVSNMDNFRLGGFGERQQQHRQRNLAECHHQSRTLVQALLSCVSTTKPASNHVEKGGSCFVREKKTESWCMASAGAMFADR